MTCELGKLVVYGAGGHGLVVAEAAAAAGWRVLGFFDDDPQAAPPAGWTLLKLSAASADGVAVHVAIGDNAARRQVSQRLESQRWRVVTVAPPSAVISRSATVGEGVFVGARAVINGRASVGQGAIVNTGAIIEHHCAVGAFTHVAPGAILCGGAAVGPGALIGAGAVILPQRKVATRGVIGAGAVVASDVPEGQRVVGVPARPAK